MIFSWAPLLSLVLLPLFVTLNMIPKVALGPLFIVWFSYGIVPNILIAFSICFFPILLTTARGLREVEPDLLDLVKSLRGSRWTLFRKIQLPGSLPYVFSGMKVGAILAVAGAIVGEFIASERGLGYLMIQVQSSLDTPAMVMAVVLLTLLGVALYGLVLVLERMFVVGDARQNLRQGPIHAAHPPDAAEDDPGYRGARRSPVPADPGADRRPRKVEGDILILGVAGKMGPTLARLAKRAAPIARVIGVARFSDPSVRDRLQARGVETIACDLLDRARRRGAAEGAQRRLHGRPQVRRRAAIRR